MSQSNEDTGRDGGGGGGGGDGVRIDINSSAVGAPTADADEDGVVTLPDDVPDRLKSYKKIKAADSKTMSRLQRALKLEHIARCDVYTGLGVSTPWGRLFGGEILAQVLLEYVRKYVMFGAALASMCRCVLRTYFLHSRHGACPCVVTKTLHSTTTRTHARTHVQAMMAACATVPDTHHVHSLHGYFILAGQNGVPVMFTVERTRTGRSFMTRTVNAQQENRSIFTLMISFHRKEPGMNFEVCVVLMRVRVFVRGSGCWTTLHVKAMLRV